MDLEHRSEFCNIPKSIEDKLGRNLHNQTYHPVEIIKNTIYSYFDSLNCFCPKLEKFDDLSPIVSVIDNFDKLLIPQDHVARSRSDTYYINEKTVLRTHTSAHQNELLSKGYQNFLVTGDVYRKDEIDRYHYPIFHQMEGVFKVPDNKDPTDFLIEILGGLAKHLFPNCEYRVNDDYFPFTEPSFEIEVFHNNCWVEILGCGITKQQILDNNSLTDKYVAFGLGLERYCMIAFDIPDIRYLWSTHERFTSQFQDGTVSKFKPYSELQTVIKDVSFWIKDQTWIKEKETDFMEFCREVCGDNIEKVELLDQFYHSKKQQHSRTYRMYYSPNDPSLKNPSEFNDLVNNFQQQLTDKIEDMFDVQLR